MWQKRFLGGVEKDEFSLRCAAFVYTSKWKKNETPSVKQHGCNQGAELAVSQGVVSRQRESGLPVGAGRFEGCREDPP